MNTPNDGGSAFPKATAPHFPYDRDVDGMTLREYYAGQVIVGLLANPRATPEWINAGHHITSAWAIADAMLKAREEQP